MTNEELMVPRFKQLALYPECERHGYRRVGDIWTDDNKKPVTNQLGEVAMPLRWEVFPELFKPLQWWENRQPEDMPGFVKWKRSAGDYVYCRVLHPSKDCREFGHEDDTVEHRFVFNGGYELATKEEYETYLSNKHKQKK